MKKRFIASGICGPYKHQFVVMRTVGNDYVILKSFAESEKQKALAYGEAATAENTAGVIICSFVCIDKDGNFRGNEEDLAP